MKGIFRMRSIMKKYLLIIFCSLILTGCANESINKSEKKETVVTTDLQVETINDTMEIIELTEENEVLPNNIKKVDLSLPENSKYIKSLDEFTYNKEYELSDGRKIVEDKCIYLEEPFEERTILVDIINDQQYAVFCGMIDENRFYYYIIEHESTAGMGIYNLETQEDFRIDKTEDNIYHYVPRKIIGNSLLLEKCKIATCGGWSRIDLDSYEVTDFKCTFMQTESNYSAVDFSSDGTKAALYKRNKIAKNANEMNEYKISIYSVDEDKEIDSYIFSSKNNYINHRLYYNEDNIYFYAYYFDDHPKNFAEASQYIDEPIANLYIINL